VAEERRPTRKSHSGAHKRARTDSLGDGAAAEAVPTSQEQKQVPGDGGSEPKHANSLSVEPQVQPPAVENGFRDVKPKRIRGGPQFRGKGVQQAPKPEASSLFLPHFVIPKLYSGAVSGVASALASTSGGSKEARQSSLVFLGHTRSHPPPPSVTVANRTEAMEAADAASSSATTPSLPRAPQAAYVQATV